MRATTVLPFAAVLLLGGVAHAQAPVATPMPTPIPTPTTQSKPAGYEMVYDDEARTLHRPKKTDRQETPLFIPSTARVRLKVANAPCGVALRWQVSERELEDVGAEVRGLDQVAGLVSSVVSAGVAKGVVPLERLNVTARDLVQVVDLLATAEGPGQLSVEIESEWSAFGVVFKDICERVDRYQNFAQKFVEELTSGDLSLARQLDGLSERPDQRDKPPVELSKGNQLTCAALDSRTDKINLILPRFKAARTQLVSDPLAMAPSQLEESIGAFRLRLSTFIDKLEAVRQALVLMDDWQPNLKAELRLRMIKRLQEIFKDIPAIPASEIRDLADQVADRVAKSAVKEKDVNAYTDQLRTLRDKLPPSPGGNEGRPTAAHYCSAGSSPTDAYSLRAAAEDLLGRTRDCARILDDTVRGLNAKLRLEIARLGEQSLSTRRNVVVDAIGPWPENTIVTVKVFRRWAFHAADLSVLDSAVVTQEARAESLKEAPPTNFTEVAGRTFEVHDLYKGVIGVGPLLTGVGSSDYTVRQVLRVDSSGQVVPGPDGNPIYDSKLIETGHEGTRLDYAVFLSAYLPHPFDSFPSQADKVAYGVTLGIPLNDAGHNVLLGLFVQPTPFCQIAMGVHWGRRTVPEAGIVPGVTVLPPGTTTAPTRDETVTKGFISVILDAHIVKKILGKS